MNNHLLIIKDLIIEYMNFKTIFFSHMNTFYFLIRKTTKTQLISLKLAILLDFNLVTVMIQGVKYQKLLVVLSNFPTLWLSSISSKEEAIWLYNRMSPETHILRLVLLTVLWVNHIWNRHLFLNISLHQMVSLLFLSMIWMHINTSPITLCK